MVHTLDAFADGNIGQRFLKTEGMVCRAEDDDPVAVNAQMTSLKPKTCIYLFDESYDVPESF
jgi:hypothetical protein